LSPKRNGDLFVLVGFFSPGTCNSPAGSDIDFRMEGCPQLMINDHLFCRGALKTVGKEAAFFEALASVR
jgi:hypothetical protein